MRLGMRQKILSLLLVAVLTGAAAGVSLAQSGKGKSTPPSLPLQDQLCGANARRILRPEGWRSNGGA